MHLRDGLRVERPDHEVVVVDRSGKVVYRANGREAEALIRATAGTDPTDLPDHLVEAAEALTQAGLVERSQGFDRRRFLFAGGATWAAATATTLGLPSPSAAVTSADASVDGNARTPTARTVTDLGAAANNTNAPLDDLKAQYAINVKDHGAVGDRITDDTAAIQAAVDAVGAIGVGLPAGALYFPPGIYKVTDTIVIQRKQMVLQGNGIGNPTTYFNPGRGTTVEWHGTSPKPVFQVFDSWFVDFRDLHIGVAEGKVAAAGVFFGGDGTQTIGANHRCALTKCAIKAIPWGSADPPTGRFEKCIWVGGSVNEDNDEFHFDGNTLGTYTDAGLAIDNTHSVWGSVSNTTFEGGNGVPDRNGVELDDPTLTGIRANADLQVENCAFNRNALDIHVITGQMNVNGLWSEHCRQAVVLETTGAKLNLRGGKTMVFSQWLDHGTPPLIDHKQLGTNAVVNLDGWWVSNAIGEYDKPVVKVRGNASDTKGTLAVRHCTGIKLKNVDARAVYTPNTPEAGVYVDFNSVGRYVRQTLTGNQVLDVTQSHDYGQPVVLTAAAYAALSPPDPATLYVVVG